MQRGGPSGTAGYERCPPLGPSPLTSVWPGAALIIACPIQAVSGGAQGDSIRTN